MNFTIQEVVKSTRGRLVQVGVSRNVKGVSIDSRRIKRNNLFVAIKGSLYDGHDFIEDVIRKGSSCLVVSKRIKIMRQDINVIMVKDTTKALGQIASFYRQKFDIPLIAITGSTGKTTTKEMLASVLRSRYKVLKNFKTENNHIGVPLTLLRLKGTHDVIVLEFGTNQFGDIAWLTKIARPTVAVLTNIGESHLKRLHTPLGVFKEKSQLVKLMPVKGCVIYNSDDKYLRKLKGRITNKQIITYAINRKGNYRASGVKINNRQCAFTLNRHAKLILKTPVYHNVYNSLAAISCSRLFHIPYNDIQKILHRFQFSNGRSVIKQLGRSLIIDDTYNSNPLSFKSAIETLKNINTNKRRILICADMLELGSKAKQYHKDIGKLAARANFDLIVSMGPLASLITETAKKHNDHVMVGHYDNLQALHKRLKRYCQKGDVVLVKGSRGMRMERTIDFLGKFL